MRASLAARYFKNRTIMSTKDRSRMGKRAELWGYFAPGVLRSEQLQLNTTTIDLLGVSHAMSTWEQYGGEIQKFIDSADIISLEMIPSLYPMPTEEELFVMSMIFSIAGLGHMKQEDVIDFINDSTLFFGKVTEYARKKRKTIIHSDFEFQDMAVPLAVDGTKAFITYKTWMWAKKILTDKKEEIRKRDMTRRDFVQSLFAGTAGLAAGGHIATQLSHIAELFFPLEYDLNAVRPLALDTIDIRDMLIAAGIHKAANENEEARICTINGLAHMRGVRNYLQEPKAIETKWAAYKVHTSFRKPKMRIFTPNEAGEYTLEEKNLK